MTFMYEIKQVNTIKINFLSFEKLAKPGFKTNQKKDAPSLFIFLSRISMLGKKNLLISAH